MSSRAQNEKKSGQWDELPDGGRRYRLDVTGRLGWLARYLKDVDANETTRRFWQQVYDDHGKLVEVQLRNTRWIPVLSACRIWWRRRESNPRPWKSYRPRLHA